MGNWAAPQTTQPFTSSDVSLVVTNGTGAGTQAANLNVTVTGSNFDNQGNIRVTGNTAINFTGAGTFTSVGAFTSNVNFTNGNPMEAGVVHTFSATANGDLHLVGSGTVGVLGNAANTVTFTSNGGNLFLDNSRTYQAGDNGTVNFNATGGRIIAGAGVISDTGTVKSPLILTTLQLNMGAGSAFSTAETTGTGITVQSPIGANDLSVVLGGANTTLNTKGSDILVVNPNANQTLQVNGLVAGTSLKTTGGGQLNLAVNNGTINNNSVISSSGALMVEGKNGGGSTNLTFSNSGNYWSEAAANVVEFKGNTITVNNGVTLGVQDPVAAKTGANLKIIANKLDLGAGSAIDVKGTTVDIVSNGGGTINVALTGGGSRDIVTTAGGNVNFETGRSVDFTGTGTLNFKNANVNASVTNGTGFNVGANVTLNVAERLGVGLTTTTFVNNGVINSQGVTITSSGSTITNAKTIDAGSKFISVVLNNGGVLNNNTGASITVADAKMDITTSAGAMTINNDGGMTVTGATGGNVKIESAGALTLSNTANGVISSSKGTLDIKGASVNMTNAGTVSTGTGNLKIESTGTTAMTLNNSGTISTTGADLTVTTNNNADMNLSGNGKLISGTTINLAVDDSGALPGTHTLNVGAGGQRFQTGTATVTAKTISFTNDGALNFNVGNTLTVNTENIDINGSTGTISTDTSAAGQGINFVTSAGGQFNIGGTGTKFFVNTTGGAGLVSVNPAGKNLTSFNVTGNIELNTNSNLQVITGDINITNGKINNGGTKTVTLINDGTVTEMGIGGSALAKGFNLDQAEMNNIFSNTVNIGNSAGGTAKMFLSDIDVSGAAGSATGKYILNLYGKQGIVQVDGKVSANDIAFASSADAIDITSMDVQTLRFQAGTTASFVNTGGSDITINSMPGGGGKSQVGTSLMIQQNNKAVLMDNTTSVHFTGATATATFNGLPAGTANALGSAANPLVFRSSTAPTLNLSVNGGANVGSFNIESNFGITTQTALRGTTGDSALHTNNLVNANLIQANLAGGTLTIDNTARDGGNFGNVVVSGAGSMDAKNIVFNSAPGTDFTITQNRLGPTVGVNDRILSGNVGRDFTMTINGTQDVMNIGDATHQMQSGGKLGMTFTSTAAGNGGVFRVNLGNTLKSNGEMSVTTTRADLLIPYSVATKVDAGAANAIILSATNTPGNTNGAVTADFESATGIIRGAALGTTAGHTDWSVTVYDNNGAKFGGGGVNAANAGIRSTQGSIIMRAMDPNSKNDLTSGTGAIGRGGSLLIVDDSFVKAGKDITVAARQQITVGNVLSYDQNADPSAAGNKTNPITPNPGGSLGVRMEAGTFSSALTASVNLTNLTGTLNTLTSTTIQNFAGGPNVPMFTNNELNYQAVATVGKIVLDNRNPDNPGQQLPGTAVGGQAKDAGAWELFGSANRNVLFGDNVSLVGVGGSASSNPANPINTTPNTPNFNTVINPNQVTFGGGVQVTSANTFSAGTGLTVGSYGGNVVLDGANGILLSNNTPGKDMNSPGVTTATNNLFSVAQRAMPATGAGTANAKFFEVKINPSNTPTTNFPLNLYSGGQVGVYAGVPLGPRQMQISTGNTNRLVSYAVGAPIVSIEEHLFNMVMARDVFNYLTIANTTVSGTPTNTGFNAGFNKLAGAGGSLVIVLSEALSQNNPKVTNGLSINTDGGVIMIDPPPTGAFVNLGGATEIRSIAPQLPPPAGAIPPPGVTPSGFVITTTTPTLNINFVVAGVGTDSTRTVTLSLNQTAQSMLGDNMLKKKEGLDNSGAYYVAGGACQPFFLEDDQDTMLVGEQGTTLSPGDKRSITLNQGKVVAMVGKQPVKVETGFGNVQIAGNSAAVIQQTADGVVRVANLSGQATTVTVTRNGKTETLTANAGEEICLADEALAEEELIPVDGVDREPIQGSITVPGIKLAKSKFDQKMMVEKEKLLVCNAGSFYAAKNKINNLKNDINKNAKPLRPGGAAPAGGPAPKPLQKSMILELPSNSVAEKAREDVVMTPISFQQNSGSSGSIRTFSTHSALVKHDGKAMISFEHPTIMQLTKGETLVSADKLTMIKTPHSMITINPGTIALISVVDNVTKVRNLWESGTGTIRQSVNGKFVDICAGQESILGMNEMTVNKALNKDQVGRRRMRNIDVPGGMRMARAEVSLVTVMQNVNFIADLVNSNNQTDKALVAKMVKMAAVCQQATAKHGQYQTAAPPLNK
jgi:hypothetical protein